MAEIGVNLKGILAQFDELDKKLKATGLEAKSSLPSFIPEHFAKVVAIGHLSAMFPHVTAFIKLQATSEEWIYKLAALMDIDPGKVEKFIEDSYTIKRPIVDENISKLVSREYTEGLMLQSDLFNRVAEFIFRYYSTGSGLPTLEEVRRIWSNG